jgi:hypothetical protein
MILTNIHEKIKCLPDLSRDIFLGAALLLSLTGAFMLGRISSFEEERKAELRITTQDSTVSAVPQAPSREGIAAVGGAASLLPVSPGGEEKGSYVGSKTGKIYHLPWCSGAKRIKEENKRWFASKADAEAAGYAPASNCKGI